MLLLLLLPLLWRGSLQVYSRFQLQVPESLTVQEGLCVFVSCEFSYPLYVLDYTGPFYIYWYQADYYRNPQHLVATNNPNSAVTTKTQGRFQVPKDPKTNNCSLSIGDARKSDTGTYWFRMERGRYNTPFYREKLNLYVTDLTEKPNIHIPGPLESGHPRNLTCSLPGSCEGGSRLTFSWTGDALKVLDAGTLQSTVLTLTPRPQDHGTNLTCQVNLQVSQVTLERTIQLNVSYAPENLTITIFQNGTVLKVVENNTLLSVLEGQSLRLVCVADSNPPAELTWFQGSPSVNTSPSSSMGTLELRQVRRGNEGEFTCQAKNTLGAPNISLSLSVLYPPQVLGPSCSWEADGVQCSCSVRAQPAASLRWRIGDGLVEGNSSNASFAVTSHSTRTWTNSSLSLSMELSSVLRLCCEAWNDHGDQSVTVLLLPWKSASRAEVALGALGGAGGMALLSLCVGLTFFCVVKPYRKQAAKKRRGMDNEDPVMGTVTWGCRKKPWPHSIPHDQVPHSDDKPASREEEDLHYASLNFYETKPQESKNKEATHTTNYAEIRTNK